MSTSKSGGCGCAGCGCDSGTCTDESFKRPRFFAGQLLTEDDLQAMMDYVVGKSRLHNRYLFGPGVVCGLDVTCHPCGGGQVMVAPGFALDCCGNDLILPCPEEVDIRALLRELRKRQLQGYECGDPCEEEGDRRHYGLYLTYQETPGDPVAPYNSGDPCGQQACEPTRICEGYAFELRCECGDERQLELYKRILACVGDVKSATSAIEKAGALYTRAMEIKRGTSSAAAAPSDVEAMRRDAVLLKAWLLSRLEQAGTRTRCDLYDRVKAVHLDRDQADQFQSLEEARAEADRWLDLVRVLLEYFIDCACLALNPPCGACDDTAVLLACVELDGCNVVDICNMSRRFVLSPKAMRYWLPVSLVGDLVKRFCCDLDLSRLFEVEQRGGGEQPVQPMEAPVPPPAGAAAPAAAAPPPASSTGTAAFAMRRAPSTTFGENSRIVLERIGIDAEAAVDAAAFTTGLAGLALRVGRVETGALRHRAGAVADDVIARLRPDAASVIEAPAVHEKMSAMVKAEVAASRESMVSELREDLGSRTDAAIVALDESVSAKVGKRVSEDLAKSVTGDVEKRVNDAVRKELAAAKLNGAVENLNVVKALRKENEKLRTDLGKLSEAMKKLGGKG